jgi:hypothetical protein
MIREGKIPDLPKAYTAHLGQVVKAMLKQNVSPLLALPSTSGN